MILPFGRPAAYADFPFVQAVRGERKKVFSIQYSVTIPRGELKVRPNIKHLFLQIFQLNEPTEHSPSRAPSTSQLIVTSITIA